MNATPNSRRLVVIHEDDVGMTHGANTAFAELSALGTCSSGSVMVPCPWFPEVVEMAERKPALDIGVHLTLNSEKKPYRWRPLTNPSASAGLADEMGYFWSDVPTLRRRAAPDAVEEELRAQVDAALAAGIDVTHLDAHMGGAISPEFVDIYVRLGRDYRLPVLLVRDLELYGPRHNFGEIDPAAYDRLTAEAAAEGFPIFEVALETPWNRKEDAATAYDRMFRSIPEGLTFLSMHFNAPGDFEPVEPEYAPIRVEEYELFKGERIPALIEELGLEVIGFRGVRDALREQLDGRRRDAVAS